MEVYTKDSMNITDKAAWVAFWIHGRCYKWV